MSNSSFEADGYREGFSKGQAKKVRESVHDDEFMRGFAQGSEDRLDYDRITNAISANGGICVFSSYDAYNQWVSEAFPVTSAKHELMLRVFEDLTGNELEGSIQAKQSQIRLG